MLIIANSAALARALDSPINAELKALLAIRRDQLLLDGFDEIGDIARYVIAQPDDAIEVVEAELAVPIATNIVDGSRYPDPGYQPNWDWCIRHGDMGWEAPFIMSDDGPTSVLITMDEEGVSLTLLHLCRAFGTAGDHTPYRQIDLD